MSFPSEQPTPEDIRRKLEGRLEVVERAREQYSALARWLQADDDPGRSEDALLLRQLREAEPAVEESLEALERRAQVEGWSPSLPSSVLAREVRALRTQLAKLARARSGAPIPTFFGVPLRQELRLADELEQLMVLLAPGEPFPSSQVPEREVVLQGGYVMDILSLKELLFLLVAACVGAKPLEYLFFAQPRARPAAVALGGLYVLFKVSRLWRQYLRSGRYQLTRKALFWWPSRGPPVHLPLSAISHALYTGPDAPGAWVVGKEGAVLRLEHVADAQRLTELLNEEVGLLKGAAGKRRTDAASRVIGASPSTLYRAFVDPQALVSWLPPKGMKGHLDAFEPRVGGTYRMTLTPEGAAHSTPGKSADHADVVQGRFLELVPDERIVQQVGFESGDPAFAGVMTMTWKLAAVPGGTEVTLLCENVPEGVRKEDHDEGLRLSLENLAAFTE